MGYLVDRDEILKEKFSYGYQVKDNDRGGLDTHTTYAVTEESVLNAPVVEERKHGRWEKEYLKSSSPKHIWEKFYVIKCSCCGGRTCVEYPFCMHCGAEMVEEVKQ